MVSIIYGSCFLISLVILLGAVERDNNYSSTQIFFMAVMAVGNGGYYALATSKNLEEAVLANKLTYVIGIFIPMMMFFVICEICYIKIKRIIRIVLLSIQGLLFICVCTIGKYPIYYKTVEFHNIDGVSYITKTYGPVHFIYAVTMIMYLAAVIVVASIAAKNKNRVSSTNVDTIIVFESLTICCYVAERVTDLNIELMPIADTIMLVFCFVVMTRQRMFSIYGNPRLIGKKINSSGYMVFDTKIRYMGCNETAALILPELNDWELEKKIPGSGGRFNTYIRQPFMSYIEESNTEEVSGKPFEIKGQKYVYVLDTLKSGRNRVRGYIIEINNVTEIVNS